MNKRLTAAIVVALTIGSTGASARENPLVEAVTQKDLRAVLALLQGGADVNGATADGTTPLQVAAYLDDLNIASLLIQKGANVNATNRYGASALSLAATNGDGVPVGALLTAGASPHTALPEGGPV